MSGASQCRERLSVGSVSVLDVPFSESSIYPSGCRELLEWNERNETATTTTTTAAATTTS